MSAGPFRLAILISGRGSNMIAIARACLAGSIAARVAVVISDRADAAGLAGAAALGIETATVLPPNPLSEFCTTPDAVPLLTMPAMACVVPSSMKRPWLPALLMKVRTPLPPS